MSGLRLFVIVHPNDPSMPGGWHATSLRVDGPTVDAVEAFTSEADAWTWLLGAQPGDAEHEHAMRHGWRVLELAPIGGAP